jgi:large subunit ribosomal protein L15
MQIHELKPAKSSKKDPKRVGRGDGSGRGTYAGRGSKGQKSRAGYRIRPGFEGGQLPIIKRLPRKRGFTNKFRTEFNVVNVGRLNRFEAGSIVTPETMFTAGIVSHLRWPIKILAEGDLDRALTVQANRFSSEAVSKIERAGGKAEQVGASTSK